MRRLLAGTRISRGLSQCDPVADGVDTSLLEHVSPIERDNVVVYGPVYPHRKPVRTVVPPDKDRS
jgi:hypothetical protein